MESNKKSKQKSNVMGSKSNVSGSFNDLVNHSPSNVFEDDWKPGQVTLTGFTSMGLTCSNGKEVAGGLDDSGVMNRESDAMFTHGTFFGRSSCDEFSPYFSRTCNSVNSDSVPALTQYKKIVPDDDHTGIGVTNTAVELHHVMQTSSTHVIAGTSPSDSSVTQEQCHVTNTSPKPLQYVTEPEYSSVQYQTIEYRSGVEPQPPTHVTVSHLSPIDTSRDVCEKANKITIAKSEITSESGKSGVLEKPVVADTKLFRRENIQWRPYSRIHPNPACNLSRKDSWSTPDLDKLDVESGSEKRNFSNKYRNRQSSFATGKAGEKICHKSVHLDLDLYHTVLGQDVDENEVDLNVSANQSNSQRHKFDIQGDDTLTARVQLITQKFDSFRRSQLRAISFRYDPSNCDEDTLRRRHSSSGEPFAEKKDGDASSPVVGCPEENPAAKCLPIDRTVLTASDISRIELFFNSQQTQVFSCRCLAELFVHSINPIGLSSPVTPSDNDVIRNEAYVNTGVPVLVLNAGTNVKRRRELVLVLAQQDTGFVLWQDKVNYMSEYKELHPGVHTMRVSGSTSKSVHLHMFDRVAAGEFLATFRLMTSDPRDELWKMSSQGDGKQSEEDKRWSGSRAKATKHDKKLDPLKNSTEKKAGVPKGRWKMATTTALSKADISRPCHLQLITRVDPTDEHFRFAFAKFLPVTILKHEALEEKQQDAAVGSESDDNRQCLVTK